jgi:virulence factor
MLGCGGQATSIHFASLANMDDVEMVAACDLNEEKLHAAAQKYKIAKTYTDYNRMLEQEQADAVFIVMPPHLLFDLVIAALRKKLHVFIEKPPGITATITETFAREAKTNQVIGMVGLNRRFMPMVNYAKQWIEARGGLSQAVATFYKGPTVYYNGVVDALAGDGIHSLDALRHIVGTEHQVVRLHSIPARRDSETDNAWNVIMQFSNGVTGILLLNFHVGGRFHTFEMHGSGASAFLNPDESATFFENNRAYRNTNATTMTTQQLAMSESKLEYYGFYQQDRHFIDCIRANTEPLSSFRDAAVSMRLLERIRGDSQ